MASYYPIVVDSTNSIIRELPANDTLNLTDSTIQTKDLYVDGMVYQTVNTSGASTIDLSSATYFKYTLSGSTSITAFNNANSTSGIAQAFLVEVVNNSSYNLSWPTNVKWDGGSAPALSANRNTIFTFISSDNGTTWRGNIVIESLN